MAVTGTIAEVSSGERSILFHDQSHSASHGQTVWFPLSYAPRQLPLPSLLCPSPPPLPPPHSYSGFASRGPVAHAGLHATSSSLALARGRLRAPRLGETVQMELDVEPVLLEAPRVDDHRDIGDRDTGFCAEKEAGG